MKVFFRLIFLLFLLSTAHAQTPEPADTLTKPSPAVERLKYQQQPGLALAASKIFFSDKRYSISGFGEFNFVNYQGTKNTNSGDIELYYTNLYRYATFFGYRITDKIIWNSEFQIEYLHDGTREGRHEIVVEAFVDFLVSDYFKARVGFYPLPIGYVNNNDEPVMFYSVNRSEVERLITPTTWIELGAMFYGNITPTFSYALGVSQGLDAAQYVSGTWIRQGRDIRFGVPRSLSLVPQLNYTGVPGLTVSASGYVGNSGQGARVEDDAGERQIKAPIRLGTGYVKYDWMNLRFVSVGTYGTLGDTYPIYQLGLQQAGQGQVLGQETFGYLFELGVDILPYFRKSTPHESHQKNWLFDRSEMKVPLFVRYERLNTHRKVDERLTTLPRVQNDLDILTVGANFNTRENIVFKANYQFRTNRNRALREPHILEFGMGFIF
ncbi:hypothetical protein HNQ92_005597 [Rhabdobacter roseus]|uniref:Porin n=1 Tax=Rhabdobacter roseus TaxID=1655419 RepID=A0A840TW13_9BACT|nr:porin [Rhabdobacter roseus]MBB5287434.1 hypothetical protein [Rhabdobacter roseus]